MLSKIAEVVAPRIPKAFYRLIPGAILKYYKNKYYKHYYIDIVGSCNLACPSCPSGGTDRNRGGKMDLDLFVNIVGKISLESPNTTIGLFNWTDPLVHPEVEKFIDIIHKFELSSFLSTNLNLVRDMDALVLSNPDRLRISLSGFTQEVYSIGHKTGDIEVVKNNMKALSEKIKEYNTDTKVEVYYHKYNYNMHEIDLMEDYAKSLGFYFFDDWAVYMPVERLVSYMEGDPYAEDKAFVDSKYALNVKQAMDATAPYRREDCHLKGSPITIDCRGNVALCCAVYDSTEFSVGSFLHTASADIEEAIDTHPYCEKCMSHGGHIYSGSFAHKIHSTYEKMAEDAVSETV